MASTSRTTPTSSSSKLQKEKEQKKKTLLKSNVQVVIGGDNSEARKRKTAPKSNETKQTGIQSQGKGGNRKGVTKDQQKQQQVAKRKKKIPLKSTTVGTRTRSKLEERAEDPSPVALLDMLAEVASATLKNDPSIRTQLRRRRKMNTRSAKKSGSGVLATKGSKIQRRSAQPEHLSLDQIRMLSDKLLLNMFAEMTADEIKRNYTYACFLLPEKCLQRYTSFGNENRARMQMKTHLLGHIAELLSEANGAGRASQKGKFTAEPVTARKRRLAVEQESLPVTNKRRGGAARKVQGNTASNTKTTTGEPSKKGTRGRKILKLEVSESEEEEEKAEDEENKDEKEEENKASKSNAAKNSSQSGIVSKGKVSKETETVATETSSLQVVRESISYEQPVHDHCYTTPEGGKNLPDHYDYEEDYDDGSEDGEYDEDDEEEGEEDTNMTDLRKGLVVVAQMDELQSEMSEEAQTTFRSKQAEMALRQLEAIRQIQMQKNKKESNVYPVHPTSMYFTSTPAAPNPPPSASLPKSETRRNLLELEDELMDSDSERKAQDKGSPEWERRLALKCIRMLRTKRKDEHVPLVCKICQGKRFTAQATLMYHYRSHAGIKPFLCTICNTTFTRQHSLNYHMLIHNNKSRFTCGDCGRKFRHPSHFKEHLRRHTGETPFECTDCGVRFKTRNTYKRHLKTRHGKLLTVNGIVMLTNEEFMLVKTNPKMKNQPRPKKDQQTQWPEPTTSSSLKTMAMSNIPLMADIDSGMFSTAGNNVRVQVITEPDILRRMREISAKNYIDEDGMMMEEEAVNDEENEGEMGEADENACISIGVGTEGRDVIFLEAVKMESSSKDEGEMEGDGRSATEEEEGEPWTTSESFSNQTESIKAAALLQPILQCM